MNQPISPPDPAALGAEWSARNDEVLRLGFDWLSAKIDALAGNGSDEDIERHRRAYDSARAAMEDSGQCSALDSLARLFNLAHFDTDVLLVTLAAQADVDLAAGLVEARGRHGRASICLGDVYTLLAPDSAAQCLARPRLAPDAPLRQFCLVEFQGRGSAATLSLDERIAGFLHGQDFLDPRLAGVFRILPAMPVTPALHQLGAELGERIATAPRPAAVLIGPRRSGRRAVAQEISAQFGLTPAEIDVKALPATAAEWRPLLPLIARETALLRLCLVIDSETDTRAEEGPSNARQFATDAAERLDALLLVLAEEAQSSLAGAMAVRIPQLGSADRLALWRAALPQAREWIELIADHFAFGPVEIARVAAQFMRQRPDEMTVWAACRDHAGSRLDGFAQRIEPRRSWDSIVLPPSVMADLQGVAAQVRHRHKVYGDWGYDALLPRGRGVSVLFAGPSGAGKTLAAEIIAHELSLDLYCVDLAGVVSKYIGETEKNLKRIFDAAEESGAVLFIDEADALFGKRSEVKDSHDRYANVEVSYLLQRMEAYGGLAILATNLKNHIDFAFMRRIRNVIDIPFPDFEHRLQIWRKSFPATAPLDDVDFQGLASLEIAGGNIVVIATNAAFLAAAEGSTIGMRHVAQAARAEFRKLDRALDPSFGILS